MGSLFTIEGFLEQEIRDLRDRVERDEEEVGTCDEMNAILSLFPSPKEINKLKRKAAPDDVLSLPMNKKVREFLNQEDSDIEEKEEEENG